LPQSEAAALLAAAPGPARFACATLLMGLTAAEVTALRGGDVDGPGLRLRVPGAWSRSLPMPAWLVATLPAPADAAAPLLHDASGAALTEADLQALVALAAVDAGLPQGATLTPAALRDTCIDWLLGQGLRFSELPALVGRIDADRVAAFAAHGTGEPRRQADEIVFLMPALRLAPGGARARDDGGTPAE
jgi:integrase